MALPFDIDPFGPAIPPVAPTWSGPVPLPPEWGGLDIPPVAPPAPVSPPPDVVVAPEAQAPTPDLQPGLGVPAQAIASAAPEPPEIEMPEEYVGPPVPPPPEPGLLHDFGPRQFGDSDVDNALELSRDPLATLQAEQTVEGGRAQLGRDRAQQTYDRDHERFLANQRAFNEANAATHRALAEIDDDYKRVASEKTGWASKSAPQQIAGVIMQLVGGLIQGATGASRNSGVDQVNAILERELGEHRAKMGELSDRRKGVIAQFGQNFDQYKVEETLRQAMYEQSARQVEADMANYDPRGTRFVQLSKFAQQLRAQAAASGQKFAEEDFKRRLELAKLGLETDKFRLDVRKDDRAARKDALAAAGAGKNLISPEQIKLQFGFDAERPLTIAEINSRLDALKKGKALAGGGSTAEERLQEAQAVEAEAKAAAAKTGYTIANPETGLPFTNKDGKPLTVLDPTERAKTRDITIAAANIRRLADYMGELKDKYGGALTSLGSEEAQKLRSLTSQLDFETFKAFGLGAPSEGDQRLAEGVRGGVDPTSFLKNSTAGFQAYADGVEKKANAQLRGHNYDGPAVRFHRAADLKKTEPSVEDQMVARIAGAASVAPAATATGPDLGDFGEAVRAYTPLGPKGSDPGEAKKVEEAFSILEAYADQPGERGDSARKGLAELAKTAVSPVARARAKAVLDALPGSKQRGEGAR